MDKITLLKEKIKLLAILFFIFAFSIIKAQNVLILYDDSPTNVNTVSLANALTTAGFDVTFSSVPEYLWDNTNPSLAGFDAVIHLNGTTFEHEMTLTGQLALVDFVENNKGHYIGSEWNGYQISINEMTSMQDLILLDRGSPGTGILDYTTVAEQSTHPVLQNISDFQIDNAEVNGTAHVFSSNPSVVLMTEGTHDAVVVREFGNGKVLGFHHCGNWNGLAHYSNVNIQNIVVNFINWDYALQTKESKFDKITFSPNPTSDFFQVSGLTKKENYVICNVLGAEVLNGTISENDLVDVKSLCNGIYFLKFDNGRAIKFMKE